jgi:aarF domain-containing kinase
VPEVDISAYWPNPVVLHFKILILHFNEQDGASLIQAMVSKEAKFFRQQLCTIIADILYQWMCEALGQDIAITQSSSRVRFMSGPDNRELGSSSILSTPICDYNSILRDRRLKVIFLKALNSTRRRPVLFVRFCWASFVMFVAASAVACHQILVSLSETYIDWVPIAPKRFAFSA